MANFIVNAMLVWSYYVELVDGENVKRIGREMDCCRRRRFPVILTGIRRSVRAVILDRMPVLRTFITPTDPTTSRG
jgi:hypothetical protein